MTPEEAVGLLGLRVRLQSTKRAGWAWEGEVASVVDEPSLVVDLSNGKRVVLGLDRVAVEEFLDDDDPEGPL